MYYDDGASYPTPHYRLLLRYTTQFVYDKYAREFSQNQFYGEGAAIEGMSSDKPVSQVYFRDNAWHHLAVTYDASIRQMKLIFDYESVLNTWNMPNKLFVPRYGWRICLGEILPAYQPMDGQIDEIRLSYGVLKPEEMIHLAKPDVGMMLLFR